MPATGTLPPNSRRLAVHVRARAAARAASPVGTPSSSHSSGSQRALADVEQQRARRVRVVGHVLAGELEARATSRSCRTRRARVDAALLDQPLDLRARRSRGRAPARCARGRAARARPRCSSSQRAAVRRSCHTSARCSGSPVVAVPGHDGLALVGDADPGQVRAVDAGVVERLAGHRARHVPDLARVVLDPARAREVLLELAVGAPGRRGPRRRRRCRSCPWCPGRWRGSTPDPTANSRHSPGTPLSSCAAAVLELDAASRPRGP